MKTRILGIGLIVLRFAGLALGQTDDIEYYAIFMEGAKVGLRDAQQGRGRRAGYNNRNCQYDAKSNGKDSPPKDKGDLR